MFVQELIDCPVDKSNAAERVALWLEDNPQVASTIVDMLTAQLNEVLELSKAHGTLQDFKRRELLNMHKKIVESLQQQPSALSSNTHRDWL